MEKQICQNCKYWRGEHSTIRPCRSPYTHIQLAPGEISTLYDFGCNNWAAREKPTEHRPGDGPFWAEACSGRGSNWVVRFPDGHHLCLEHCNATAQDKADELNAACRDWASAHREPRWIPCSERGPGPGELVLGSTDIGIRLMYFDGFWEIHMYPPATGQIPSPSTITHWMPLPDPPPEAA